MNEANYEGRLEVYFNNLWVSISDDEWSKSDAIVACRQLGYETQDIGIYVLYVSLSFTRS